MLSSAGIPVITPTGAPLFGMLPIIVGVALPVGVPYTTDAVGFTGLSTTRLGSPIPIRSPSCCSPVSITPLTAVTASFAPPRRVSSTPVSACCVGAVGAAGACRKVLYVAIALTGSNPIALMTASGDMSLACMTSKMSCAVASGLAANQL